MAITHQTPALRPEARRSRADSSTGLTVEWAADLVPAVTHPRRRYGIQEHARAELGRLALPASATATLHREAYFRLPVPLPRVAGAPVVKIHAGAVLLARVVDPAGTGADARVEVVDWTEDSSRDARARFLLGTKAQTLARLFGTLSTADTLPQVAVPIGRWRAARRAVLDDIAAAFAASGPIIVRSSAAGEDSWHQSQAGAYESVSGVDPRDTDAVERACQRVWGSYRDPQPDDEILIQPERTWVAAAGVITTREPSTKAPYDVVACDDSSGRTDTVTAGTGAGRTVYVARGAEMPATAAPWVGPAVAMARELEYLVGTDELDVEFALTRDNRMVLLQVRRLAGRAAPGDADASFALAAHQVRQGMREVESSPALGSGVHLSSMLDWNPAEMIGQRPPPLARSLYEYLITDEVWAASRHRLGYRDLRGFTLMVDLAGYAFIDARTALNSFVPSQVSDSTAAALVDHYLRILDAAPHLHDKAEFDVAVTCLDFRWPQHAARLAQAGFTPGQITELRQALQTVTQHVLQIPQQALDYLARSADFDRAADADLDLPSATARLGFVRCHGTPMFADAARAGFVAMSLLRTLIDLGASTPARVDAYMTSLHTVSSELVEDGQRVAAGELDWNTFLGRYGHLRPGTYDISSPTYGSSPDTYLGHAVRPQHRPREAVTTPWEPQHRHLVHAALKELGLSVTPEELQAFIRAGIELRERVKFDFTRHLSQSLESIAAHYGARGLNRDTLSFLRLGDLWTPAAGWADDIIQLLDMAADRRSAYEQGAFVRLPDYCTSPGVLDSFEVPAASPNFVGQNRVRATVTVIGQQPHGDPSGKVVVIEAADPGHDWIFTHPIAGLITRYGGLNSHMAIRAAELGLPAAIGVGEALYTAVAASSAVDLDCGARQVTPL